MSDKKYTCRCGKQATSLTSYFKQGVRFTMCDVCAEENGFKNNSDIIKVDYDKIKKSHQDENFYHIIDTREKR